MIYGNWVRIPVKIGQQIIGWYYPIVPSEDEFRTDDYTLPKLYYVPNETRRL